MLNLVYKSIQACLDCIHMIRVTKRILQIQDDLKNKMTDS